MLRKLAMITAAGFMLAVTPGRPAAAESRQAAPDRGTAERKTVWQGVYTTAQAMRGRKQYETSCSGCHGTALSGGSALPLKGPMFMDAWGEDSLKSLFDVIQKTMPRGNPSSLSDEAYLEIVAYILEANSFPAGAQELQTGLETIRIEGENGPEPVPNFALIRVAGCLAQGSGNRWTLTDASEPVRTRDPGASKAADLQKERTALGSQTFQLMNIYPRPEAHKGNKVEVKGLLIREKTELRINVTSVESIETGCSRSR